jgi:hypothetical protein
MQYQNRLTSAPKCLTTVSAVLRGGETGRRRDTRRLIQARPFAPGAAWSGCAHSQGPGQVVHPTLQQAVERSPRHS